MRLTYSRVGLVFMGRRSGIPINRNINRIMDGSVAIEDLDMGVGLIGLGADNSLVSRLGIYHFTDSGPMFRHAINFDRKTGRPLKRLPSGEAGPPKTLLEPDMAMANWMRPVLFGDEVPAGAYRWKAAPLAPLSDLDKEEAREADSDLEFVRPRWFFSQDRTAEAATAMFRDNLVFDRAIERAEIPEPVRLLLSSDLATSPDEVAVSKSALRSCCVQKFLGNLHSRWPDFGGIKLAAINAMRMIDLAYGEGSRALAAVSAGRFAATLLANAESHFKDRKLETAEFDHRMAVARNAVNLITCYARTGDQGVRATVIPRDKLLRESDAAITVVRPSFSVQALDGIEMESHFPSDGNDLFQ